MRRITILAGLFLTLSTGLANAQNYQLVLAAENALPACNITKSGGAGPFSVHVFVTGTAGVTGLQFALLAPACWAGAVWQGDTLAETWLSIGNTQEPFGLSVAFGGCRELPLYIGTVNFIGVNGSPCCELVLERFVDPIGVTAPLVTDCTPHDFQEVSAVPGSLIVNADDSCPCDLPLPVEETTWGRVKALYR